MKSDSYSARLAVVAALAQQLMPQLPYHNFNHALDVYSTTQLLAKLSNLDSENGFLLNTGALLHDLVVVPGAKDNEEVSAKLAGLYLSTQSYSSSQVNQVQDLILATKMPQQPHNYLEQLICDADLDNLGRPDFLELGEKVRQELKLPAEASWYQRQLSFLKSHQYHTSVARELRADGKAANIQRLEQLMEVLKC